MIQENVLSDNTILLCGKTACSWTVSGSKVHVAISEYFPTCLQSSLLNRRDHDDLNSGSLNFTTSFSVSQLLYLRAWFNENGHNSQPLLNLLHMSSYFACTDPRDRVYALLGLASDLDLLKIQPDYTKSAQRRCSLTRLYKSLEPAQILTS
jgi:hypothetical protein